MITIKNTQRSHTVDAKHIEKTAQTIITELGYSDFDLGIWLTTNKTIHSYNKMYRKKNKPTDILSFPYHANLEPGEKPTIHDEEDKNLGDLIISVEFVHGILELYKGITLQERIDTLLIHGICHLLGYSHYDEDNDKLMVTLEKKLAKKIG
jgi:probable rRNA maturation factor